MVASHTFYYISLAVNLFLYNVLGSPLDYNDTQTSDLHRHCSHIIVSQGDVALSSDIVTNVKQSRCKHKQFQLHERFYFQTF